MGNALIGLAALRELEAEMWWAALCHGCRIKLGLRDSSKRLTFPSRILLPIPSLYVLYLSVIMPGSKPSCKEFPVHQCSLQSSPGSEAAFLSAAAADTPKLKPHVRCGKRHAGHIYLKHLGSVSEASGEGVHATDVPIE